MSSLPLPIPLASGQFLAELLSGCWRKVPPTAPVDAAQLEAHLPALSGSGTGALAWRRLRHSALSNSPGARGLQQLHLKQALDTKIQEKRIAGAFEALRAAGVEPILVKGWATARFYPEPGLRPVGDIDLLIRPGDAGAMEGVLGVKVDEWNRLWDVKSEVPRLYRVSREELFQGQQRVMLGETEIGVLGAEDHLRILCLHFFKHGGWRPLWLCDIAAAVEFRPPDFNWERCLGRDRRSADAIACTIGLAHQLLGASVENTPVAPRAAQLPSWLVPAILKEWQRPQSSQHPLIAFPTHTLNQPKSGFKAVLSRWPNPISAVIHCQTPLDWPPFPAQSASFVSTGFSFLKRNSLSPGRKSN